MKIHLIGLCFLITACATPTAPPPPEIKPPVEVVCRDPKANNYGQKGDCTYTPVPPQPLFKVGVRNIGVCAVAGYPDRGTTYADTTASAAIPNNVELGRYYLYLTDSLGTTYYGGVPVSWASEDSSIYSLHGSGDPTFNKPGTVGVVGTLTYQGVQYSGRYVIQVVADKIENCK